MPSPRDARPRHIARQSENAQRSQGDALEPMHLAGSEPEVACDGAAGMRSRTDAEAQAQRLHLCARQVADRALHVLIERAQPVALMVGQRRGGALHSRRHHTLLAAALARALGLICRETMIVVLHFCRGGEAGLVGRLLRSCGRRAA
jgi:hypothetical protein